VREKGKERKRREKRERARRERGRRGGGGRGEEREITHPSDIMLAGADTELNITIGGPLKKILISHYDSERFSDSTYLSIHTDTDTDTDIHFDGHILPVFSMRNST